MASSRQKATWSTLLRDKEIRVVTGSPVAPHAMTVLYLSGQVVVEVDRGFWLDTPGQLREEALRAHVDEVREVIGAIGSPAKIIGFAALLLRVGFSLLGGGLSFGLAGGSLSPAGAVGIATAILLLIPPRWTLVPVRPLVALWVRRRLFAGGRALGSAGAQAE